MGLFGKIFGGVEFMRSNAAGEILLPAVNPPATSSYLNRNTIVKAWGKINGGVYIENSYNCSSVTQPTTAEFLITFTRAMPNNDYSAVATPIGGTSLAYAVIRDFSTTQLNVKTFNTDHTAGSWDFNFILIGN